MLQNMLLHYNWLVAVALWLVSLPGNIEVPDLMFNPDSRFEHNMFYVVRDCSGMRSKLKTEDFMS